MNYVHQSVILKKAEEFFNFALSQARSFCASSATGAPLDLETMGTTLQTGVSAAEAALGILRTLQGMFERDVQQYHSTNPTLPLEIDSKINWSQIPLGSLRKEELHELILVLEREYNQRP